MRELKKCFGFYIFAILVLLIFSNATTPLVGVNCYNFDSPFYTVIGRAINNGKLLYRDYFDLKGPLFFFWEALGLRIYDDRMGIFLLQAISAVFSVHFVMWLCDMFGLNMKKRVIVFAFFEIVFSGMLWGGNTLDEYILPISLAALFFGIRYIKGIDSNVIISLFYGIAFGICVFSKLTASITICSVILSVMIFLIKNKKYVELIKAGLLFFAGLMAVSIPVILYFYVRGNLTEMLKWVFQIGLMRAMDGDYALLHDAISSYQKWESLLFPCYLGLIYSLLLYRRTEEIEDKADGMNKVMLLLPLSLINYVVLHLGSSIDYYILSLIPLLLYEVLLFIEDLEGLVISGINLEEKELQKKIRYILFIFASLSVIFMIFLSPAVHMLINNVSYLDDPFAEEFYDAMKEAYDIVPEAERDDMVCIDMGVQFFDMFHIDPANKCPYNSYYFGMVINDITGDDLVDELSKKKHKWLFTRFFNNNGNAEMISEIEKNYIKVNAHDYLQLYKAKP